VHAWLLWPYFWTTSLRLASVYFKGASSDTVHDERMWSRLPQPLHVLGMPRPPRLPRLRLLRPPCDLRPTATNAEMGEGGPFGVGMSAPGSSSSMFWASWKKLAITSSADMM
jgi:hypothetical protein